MKYLVYFRPNKELSDLILSQDEIIVPSSGLHSTLCFFYMGSEYEEKLISDLSKIRFYPFEFETLEFDDFDKGSLVLKLSCSSGLLQLHKEIISVVGDYADLGFDKIVEKYFGDKYNPHLTISDTLSNFDRDSTDLVGCRGVISQYYLSKKVDGVWEEVKCFDS